MKRMIPIMTDKRMNRIFSKGILFADSEEYPPLLQQSALKNKPPLSYLSRNDPKALIHNQSRIFLSCVGSRKMDLRGYRAIHALFSLLDSKKYVVISGGAIGGDREIHLAALRYSIPTISIIGSGLKELYPASNYSLFMDIIDAGGIIFSPFSDDAKAAKWQFCKRNEVIAAFSSMVLVIQGGLGSGTLITARSALSLGRQIGIMPGPINDPLYEGSMSLLSDGAYPVETEKDIEHIISIPPQLIKKIEINSDKDKKKEKKKNFLDNDEKIMISALSNNSLTTKDLMKKTDFSLQKFLTIIDSLIQKKYVQIDVFGKYMITDVGKRLKK